jgi:hypothetical protein
VSSLWSEVLIGLEFLRVSAKLRLFFPKIYMSRDDVFAVVAMEFFSLPIPLWMILLIVLIVVLLVWQFFRFTVRLLLFIGLFFLLLIVLDFLGVFSWVQQNILSAFL